MTCTRRGIRRRVRPSTSNQRTLRFNEQNVLPVASGPSAMSSEQYLAGHVGSARVVARHGAGDHHARTHQPMRPGAEDGARHLQPYPCTALAQCSQVWTLEIRSTGLAAGACSLCGLAPWAARCPGRQAATQARRPGHSALVQQAEPRQRAWIVRAGSTTPGS